MIMSFRLAFTIDSDTRYLAALRAMVSAVAAHNQVVRFSKALHQQLSLALIEAVDNAIFHAHRRKKTAPITIIFRVTRRRVTIEIGDTGPGLNHQSAIVPRASATHGRGLFLMRAMMGRVESVRHHGMHWIRMTRTI